MPLPLSLTSVYERVTPAVYFVQAGEQEISFRGHQAYMNLFRTHPTLMQTLLLISLYSAHALATQDTSALHKLEHAVSTSAFGLPLAYGIFRVCYALNT